LKYSILLFLIILLFASCKTPSVIVTSKAKAKELGIYQLNSKELAKKVKSENKKAAKNNKEIKKATAIEIKQKKKIVDENDPELILDSENTSYFVKQLINVASENLGANYKSGGTTKEGFDCSGFMYATFKNLDIILPRSSNDMAKIGKKLEPNEIQKGDLIFFKTNGKRVINHVGLVIDVNSDEIKFIHSATSKGVIISSTKEEYYNKTFTQANRIF
jgi:lipoprotein Spr